MPNQRLSMRKLKEILRLARQGLPHRQIARSCGVSRPTVANYVARFAHSGLPWPLPDELTETQLEQRLFPPRPRDPSAEQRAVPDWSQVHRELKRKAVTLALLWQEYREQHPTGYEYVWFCQHYRAWRGKLNVVMRQDHKAGEKLFVDYAGMTMPIVDPETGAFREAQLFVAVLGASSYTYVEATWTQGLADWIASPVRCFAFLGGVPEIVVPDNLRSAVSRSHRYDPQINPTYQDLARHYGVAVVPARVRRPKDKSKAEIGVSLAERWILASLRKRTVFSLAELNREIRRLLKKLNHRPFKKLPGCRRDHFEQLDRPVLRPLPEGPYELATWKTVRVHIDYHVTFEKHHYSVPYALVGRELDLRATERVIECLHRGERVASHPRSRRPGGHTTAREHMPEAHRKVGEWSPERLSQWARKQGPSTQTLIEQMMAARDHPQQAFRACLGILRLGKSYGNDRLEAACRRALHFGTVRYRSIESILKHRLDEQPLEDDPTTPLPADHGNLRGAGYYH